MRSPFATLIAIVTLGVALGARAEPEQPPSNAETRVGLMTLWQQARARDPQWAIAGYNATIDAERLKQVRGQFLPNVVATGQSTETEAEVTYDPGAPFASGRRDYKTESYGATLTQPLFEPGLVPGYRAAKALRAGSDAERRAAEQDLMVRVADAYFGVLLAQDSLALAQAQKTAIARQLQQARRGFELGTLTITDTHEAQARYDLVAAQEIAARGELDVRREALASIVGEFPPPLKPLRGEIPLAQPQGDSSEWLQRAQAGNLTIEARSQAALAARHEVNRERAGHLPTVDLVASYSDTTSSGSALTSAGNRNESTAIGFQLHWPLFQGGTQQARVREALANRGRAEAQLEGTRRQISLATRQAYLGVADGLARVRALEQALASSEASLRSNERGLEVGVRTAVDVLNAQQQVYNAKRDLAQARYTYLVSDLRLKAAIGRLGEADLQAVEALLEP